MKFIIKSLSIDKSDIRYQIHRVGCKDINQDSPVQVNEVEANNAEELKKTEDDYYNSISDGQGWKTEIMNCCKKLK